MTRRVFLFLQGPSSPIFSKIADRLEERGHLCQRINLTMGDSLFWRRRGGHAYRGRPRDWPAFLDGFLTRHHVTDLVLLGEERDYHRVATVAARRLGIDVYVVEMGYLRPDWLTIERGGMSSNSHFPTQAAQVLAAAADLPEPDWTRRYRQSFFMEAAYDLAYNLPNVFLNFGYPFYRRHALYHPLAEYAGWILRLASEKRRTRQAAEALDRLNQGHGPIFVYPLQLQTDFQLRAHSPYNDQREAISEVLSSFARHAGSDARLAIKVHPLDNGLIGWKALITRQAQALGIGARVTYLDGGVLEPLLDLCAGVVTVNSTVGLHALQRDLPVKVLGAAIFRMEGLTDSQPLDRFWTAPRRPDPALCRAFLRLLAVSVQVRGNFYSKAGTDAGAEAIAERLHRRDVNEPGAFIDPPPRLRPAKTGRSA
ncbi:capsular biosynthesis protein [Xaviernesmea oryzae]|uniref:Capsular biosynthesis protein n=1 Tax=Xaviernesmea oryzae TaxID=464029 RepID=A0A1Q9AS53_9HYPH|nr:capsular biosynthesis protein [Xaviernesmea oryzae]OLP58240.1 capsular biosynthesis protein [Xaviernesmea oryzae]SEL45306.1 capsular polysaccharide export protein [Xaviernesmea oryzae]